MCTSINDVQYWHTFIHKTDKKNTCHHSICLCMDLYINIHKCLPMSCTEISFEKNIVNVKLPIAIIWLTLLCQIKCYQFWKVYTGLNSMNMTKSSYSILLASYQWNQSLWICENVMVFHINPVPKVSFLFQTTKYNLLQIGIARHFLVISMLWITRPRSDFVKIIW